MFLPLPVYFWTPCLCGSLHTASLLTFSYFSPLFPSASLLSPSFFSLSLSVSLSCPGSWNTLFPPSDSMSCWLTLPFHAVFFCVCVQDCSCFFSEGGCQCWTTWFLPMTNPLYVTRQHGDTRVLCPPMTRHMEKDDDAQNVESNHVLCFFFFFFLRLVWRGVGLAQTNYKRTAISRSLKAADWN